MKKPKAHIIRPIDIKPGMFVFVSKWYEQKDDEPARPVGDPLKVMAVAPPFITVQIIGNGKRGVMDTRLNEFTKCGLDWVRSLVPQYGVKQNDSEKLEQDGVRKKLQYVAKDGGFWREVMDRP